MDRIRWKSHRWRNLAQSAALLITMATLLGGLGWLIAGHLGVILAAAGTLAGFSPALTPRMALRMARARPLPYAAAPDLHATFEALARRADLDHTPELHYVASPRVNAFAVGAGQSSAVALTDGLLRVLSRRELTGVLAHELSHVRSGDTWLLNMSGVFARITRTLSTAGAVLFVLNIPLILIGEVGFSWIAIMVLTLAPSVSALLHLALSRTREFDADLGAVALTEDPMGLANAIEKLSRIERGWFRRALELNRAESSPLARTHPASSERIKRLRELQVSTPMASRGWTSRGDSPARSRSGPRSDLEFYQPRARRPAMRLYR